MIVLGLEFDNIYCSIVSILWSDIRNIKNLRKLNLTYMCLVLYILNTLYAELMFNEVFVAIF